LPQEFFNPIHLKMADSDVSKSGEKEDNAEENQSEHSSIKTIIVSHALAAVAKVVGEDELAKQCLEGGSSTEQPEEAPTDDEVKDKHDTQVVEKEEEEVKSDVRSTVVHAAGAVGGLLGGSIGAAAAGAIVGVVCDVTTAIVTGGEEMTGICEIIKDPTNKEAWVDGVSSVVSDGLAGVAGGHQTETPAQTESATDEPTEKPKEEEKPKVKSAPEPKKSFKKKSSKKSMDVDTDPADKDLVRIYDISPQTMRKILKEAGIALPDYQGGRSASDLVEELQRLIETTKNGSFILPSYFQFFDSLHELVTVHKATIGNTSPSSITLTVASASVCFDETLKRFITNLLLPIHATNKVPLEEVANDKKFHCIYRFRCTVCARQGKEFNSVGRSKNFKPRFESHTGKTLRDWMDREERMSALQKGNLLKGFARKTSSALYDHPSHSHPDVAKFSDVLEMDVVHRFSDSDKDKTIRSSWELFNQWLFKSTENETDGGP
jgi:hypothetical protein